MMYSDIYERQDNGDLKLVGNLSGNPREVLQKWRDRCGRNCGQLVVLPQFGPRDHYGSLFDPKA